MLLQDKVENFKGSIIQHGHLNDRIYLMQLSSLSTTTLPYDLIHLAESKKYSKIFAKIPEKDLKIFLSAGFLEEAMVPGFFSGYEKAIFMGWYLNPGRSKESNIDNMENILRVALKKRETHISCLENRFVLRKCTMTDVSSMVKVYREVFPSYPFPIHDPDYLLKTMQDHFNYFGVEIDGKLVAISSTEIDPNTTSAEMTDFATLPGFRGNNFAYHLLALMEDEIRKENIKTVYTIARSLSLGMNITFSKSGYQFGGRLKNNTNISGRIESMNVWYKSFK